MVHFMDKTIIKKRLPFNTNGTISSNKAMKLHHCQTNVGDNSTLSANTCDNDNRTETDYQITRYKLDRINGLRCIEPYTHTFSTYIKRRWIGKDILSVLSEEFCAFNIDYYKKAINLGHIRINNNQIPFNFILKDGQKLTHTTTLIEPPVLGLPVIILTMNEKKDIFAVDKPCGLPVHPGAAYKYNTLLELLKYKIDIHFSATCYRYYIEQFNKQRYLCNILKQRDQHDDILPFNETEEESDRGVSDISIKKLNNMILHELRNDNIHLPSKPLSFDNMSVKCNCAEKLNAIDWSTVRPLHRLDRVTSGLMLMSSCSTVASWFEEELRNRLVQKTYIARVVGHFKDICYKTSDSSMIGNNLLHTTTEQIQYRYNLKGYVYCTDQKHSIYAFTEDQTKSQTQGKYAETDFEFVCYDKELNESLIICSPKTGRTHQLRVQLLYLTYPISNDPCYGPLNPTHHVKWFPTVPHIDLNKCLNNTNKNVKDHHSSGIFLHAWRYNVSPHYFFETILPNWAFPSIY